jgi:CubicO group peptidase (beta-lactamase class C family)
MRRVLVLLLSLTAVLNIALVSQSNPAAQRRADQESGRAVTSAPAGRGSGAGALAAERLSHADALLQRYVDENRIAGAVALVLRNGQPVYERAVGWSDKEAGRRMTSDTIFRIASQTKAITSVGVLTLLEEGKIGLNDPVSRFIPAYARTMVSVTTEAGVNTSVAARRPITIRDLLTHTAGISYGTQPEVASQYAAKGLGPAAGFGWYTADKTEPICETMERLASLPFISHPGERWVYGYNTDILGCVVERASGMPLDAFLRTRITDPLGMKDTAFYLSPDRRDRLAAVYAGGDKGISRAPDGPRGQGNYVDGPRRSFAGGAGLLSTAHDYGRFLEMIRNGGELGGARILSRRAVALMTTNQVGSLHSSNGLGFGLGFETTDRVGANGLDGVGAFGWGGAYGSVYRVDPQSGLVILLMIQLLPNQTDLGQRFPATIYQALNES